MAKQIGALKFRGAIDDVCGRLTEDGAILQAKTGPTREQVLNNDNFTNTRRNAREFGGAVSASTLLRRVLGYTVKAVKHSKLVSHMNKKLHAVALSDTVSDWGERCVNKGNIHLLEGFDYNPKLSLVAALPVTLEHSLDVSIGMTQVMVPGGLVRHKRSFPADATHFRIVSCAGAVDFDKQKHSFTIATSELLPLRKVMEAVRLENQVKGTAGDVMIHTVGMVFYEVVDGVERMLRGGAMRVVQVARVAVISQGTGTLSHMAEPHACASDEAVVVAESLTEPASITVLSDVHSGRQHYRGNNTRRPGKRLRLKAYCKAKDNSL